MQDVLKLTSLGTCHEVPLLLDDGDAVLLHGCRAAVLGPLNVALEERREAKATSLESVGRCRKWSSKGEDMMFSGAAAGKSRR